MAMLSKKIDNGDAATTHRRVGGSLFPGAVIRLLHFPLPSCVMWREAGFLGQTEPPVRSAGGRRGLWPTSPQVSTRSSETEGQRAAGADE